MLKGQVAGFETFKFKLNYADYQRTDIADIAGGPSGRIRDHGHTWLYLVNANLSYTRHMGDADLTWFALAKSLLNQDIRMSTSVPKDVAPLPGRSLMVGLS